MSWKGLLAAEDNNLLFVIISSILILFSKEFGKIYFSLQYHEMFEWLRDWVFILLFITKHKIIFQKTNLNSSKKSEELSESSIFPESHSRKALLYLVELSEKIKYTMEDN